MENINNSHKRIVFISDLHMGLPNEDSMREVPVISFLKSLKGNTSHLYIVGDLFDFWFEYKTVIPNIAPRVIFELYNLVQSGIHVTLFAGNHDYWLGSYLRDQVGVHIIYDELEVSHQGKSIYIHHGDGLYPDDHGYRILKKVLRNPVSIKLFGMIHPDIARSIAKMTSKTSRTLFAPPPKNKNRNLALFRKIADDQFDRCKADTLIYGHSHIACMEERAGGTMILLGDWLTQNTYVVLEEGEFSIHQWDRPGHNNIMQDEGK